MVDYSITNHSGKGLHTEFFKLIYKHGSKIVIDKRQVIISTGDIVSNYYYIDHGIAKYFIVSEDGTEKILMVLEKGSSFGGLPIILESPTTLSVLVEPSTILYKIDKKRVLCLLDQSHAFRMYFITQICLYGRHLSAHVSSLCFESATDRLYNLLASSTKEKPTEECWYELKRRFNQNEMASIIGASRVTVSKALNELCEQKRIRVLNRTIYVKK